MYRHKLIYKCISRIAISSYMYMLGDDSQGQILRLTLIAGKCARRSLSFSLGVLALMAKRTIQLQKQRIWVRARVTLASQSECRAPVVQFSLAHAEWYNNRVRHLLSATMYYQALNLLDRRTNHLTLTPNLQYGQ